MTCNIGGKASYYKGIRAFINWLVRIGYLKDNPLRYVDPPKPEKKVLPSLTTDQVDYLIECADELRHKAIIAFFTL